MSAEPKMCIFDESTLRCPTCGYQAARLPTFRRCRTLRQLAEARLVDSTTRRIRVPPLKLGTAVSTALKAVGITPELVKRVTRRKDCGCKGRQVWLDSVGAAASAAAERALNAAANAVAPHPFSDDEVNAVANSLAASAGTNRGLVEHAAKQGI